MTFFNEQRKQVAEIIPKEKGSLYRTLCVTEGELWDQARNQVDHWINNFPIGKKRKELLKDLQSPEDTHLGAFFELATYNLFLTLGLNIEVNNDKLLKYPDFFLRGDDGQKYCVEVTSIQDSDIEKEKRHFISAICNRINNKINLPYSIIIDFKIIQNTSNSKLDEIVDNIIANVPNNIEMSKTEMFQTLFTYNDANLTIEIQYFNDKKSSCAGYKPPIFGFSSDIAHEIVKRKIEDKIYDHNKFNPQDPLVIVLGFCTSQQKSLMAAHGANALYGPLKCAFNLETKQVINYIDGSLAIVSETQNTNLICVIDLKRMSLTDAGWEFWAINAPNIYSIKKDFDLLKDLPISLTRNETEFSIKHPNTINSDKSLHYLTNLIVS